MNKAKEIYSKLMSLYRSGNRDLDSYFKVIKGFVNVVRRSGKPNRGITTVFELNGRTYDMYHTINSDMDYTRFIEDCAMMVYRLNGGQGYNTYELAAIVRSV